MTILEITLTNPIGMSEIDRLKSVVESAGDAALLLIDTGEHAFESLSVIKYFREQMQIMEPVLLEFNKIAMVHPPQYNNKSSNPEKYNYFTAIKKARKWLLQEE